MAETTRRPRATKPVEDTPTDNPPADPGEVSKQLTATETSELKQFSRDQLAAHLRRYMDWRRAQLKAPRLGGNPGGAAMIKAANAAGWLEELGHFAEWLEAGTPDDASVLNEEDRVFWVRARNSGLPVPSEILKQLGD